jgi:hypothetical protein
MAFTRESLDIAARSLSLLSMLGTTALAVRLVVEKLHPIYPFFFAWLVAEVLRAAALLTMRSRSAIYAWTYVFTEPIIWLFYFLIVWELYSLVLKAHPAIASTGKRVMLAGMGVALLFVANSLRGDLSNPEQPFPILLVVHVAGRAVVSTLGAFLLLVTLVLVVFPIQLSRNTLYYCVGYAIFFCAKAIVLICRNVMGPEIVQYASIANLLVANVCIFLLLGSLNREGEAVPRAVGQRWSPAEAERLLSQLKTINDTLTRRNS